MNKNPIILRNLSKYYFSEWCNEGGKPTTSGNPTTPQSVCKQTRQLNSTQQRITDAGVWHLLVRIIIIYYHKLTILLYNLI